MGAEYRLTTGYQKGQNCQELGKPTVRTTSTLKVLSPRRGLPFQLPELGPETVRVPPPPHSFPHICFHTYMRKQYLSSKNKTHITTYARVQTTFVKLLIIGFGYLGWLDILRLFRKPYIKHTSVQLGDGGSKGPRTKCWWRSQARISK